MDSKGTKTGSKIKLMIINLIIYGPSAVENCKTLKKAYNTCIKWVRQYEV